VSLRTTLGPPLATESPVGDPQLHQKQETAFGGLLFLCVAQRSATIYSFGL